jgi:hypothetical protein
MSKTSTMGILETREGWDVLDVEFRAVGMARHAPQPRSLNARAFPLRAPQARPTTGVLLLSLSRTSREGVKDDKACI